MPHQVMPLALLHPHVLEPRARLHSLIGQAVSSCRIPRRRVPQVSEMHRAELAIEPCSESERVLPARRPGVVAC